MNLSAVVVWYNPTNLAEKDAATKNIMRYASFVDKVYIVDNSLSDNEELASCIENAIYISNHSNVGIAAALNTGCTQAVKDGADFVLTMDQDSIWDSKDFFMFKQEAESYFCKQNDLAIVTAMPSLEPSNSVYSRIKRFIRGGEKSFPEISYCDSVICSGNIIRLSAWNSICGYEEKLFIDQVDTDFCIRLRMKNFKIICLNNFHFSHSIGYNTNKDFLFPQIVRHNDFRLYYIFRNNLYIKNKYPYYAKRFRIKYMLIIIFFQQCVFNIHALKHLGIFFNAKKDLLTIL